jgi:hypothetical protein
MPTAAKCLKFLLPGLACLASVGVTACTVDEPGSALPSPETTSPTSSTTSSSTTSPFIQMDACDVLDKLLKGQGFPKGENKTTRNECVTTKQEYGAVSLVLTANQGLSEFKRKNPKAIDISVNGRQSARLVDYPGTCMIAMKVGQNASVRVDTISVDTDVDFCPEAKRYAEALEPSLPQVP